MFGIFMESLVIFKLYTGLKLLFALTLLAWIFLLVREKEGTVRILFVYAPVLILGIFLFPLSRKLFVAAGLDGVTYYRIIWTIPMGMITCYGACRLFTGRLRIGLPVTVLLLALCGSCVYKSSYISKAENLYHLPSPVIEICNLIHPEDAPDKVQVTAVVPEELVHFIRQYDSDIRMPYGREMIASQWDYYNKIHSLMEESEVIDLAELAQACREEYCQYIILSKARNVKGDPEELGLICIGDVGDYAVYQDPETQNIVEEWAQYYREEEK